MTPAPVGSLWQLARQRAELTAHARLAVDEHGASITFAELVAAAERMAAGLAERGIGAGDVVSWQLPNRLETIVLALALRRLGAVQNPLITMLRETEVEFICREAGSTVLIVPGVFRGFDHGAMATAVAARVPGLRVLNADGGLPTGSPAALPPVPVPAVAAATGGTGPTGPRGAEWIFYTSGTTSSPKGARHVDAGLIAASETYCSALRVTADDRTAALAPIAHVGGMSHVVSSLLRGGMLVISEVFDPARTPDLLAGHGVTIVGSGLPFIRAYLARQAAQPDRALFGAARVFLCGGSPRPEALHYEVKKVLGGVGIVSGYGLTECPYATWGHIDDDDDHHARSEGLPGPGGSVVIVRPDGSRADAGETGEVRVRGPQLMLGYVDSTLDADAFDADGYFRTGDLGFLDAESYLTVTGRLKDVIIRKMENVSAREVEERLADHPAVADVAVIGVPDPETGERVCAVVVPVDPATPPTLAELCDHARTRGLNVRRLPERLMIVDQLPRNAMGKVVKPELRRRLGV